MLGDTDARGGVLGWAGGGGGFLELGTLFGTLCLAGSGRAALSGLRRGELTATLLAGFTSTASSHPSSLSFLAELLPPLLSSGGDRHHGVRLSDFSGDLRLDWCLSTSRCSLRFDFFPDGGDLA